MFYTVNHQKVWVEIVGNGQPVVLLHGWEGQNESWYPVIQDLKNSSRLIVPDLPGFGKSESPQRPFSLEDYAQTITELLERLQIKKTALVGHSFGGSIAVKMTQQYPELVTKLILTDARLFTTSSLKKNVFKRIAATGKKMTRVLPTSIQDKLKTALYKTVDSNDYPKLSGVMRETFQKVIAQGFVTILPTITHQTMLIWGEKDTATPVSEAKEALKLLPKATLKIIPAGTHFAYLDNTKLFDTIVKEFLSL